MAAAMKLLREHNPDIFYLYGDKVKKRKRRYRAVCIQQKLYVGGDDEAGDDDGYQE